MSSYLPPTNNSDFNPTDWPTKDQFETSAAGHYLPLSGGSLTGPLVGTTITCNTLQADTVDATTTVEGDIITATQNGAARANSLATYNLTLNPRSTATGNGLVQVDDHAFLYTNGGNDTGAMVIAPFSASTNGMRMDSAGRVRFAARPQVLYTLTVADENELVVGPYTDASNNGFVMSSYQNTSDSQFRLYSVIGGVKTEVMRLRANGNEGILANPMNFTVSNGSGKSVYSSGTLELYKSTNQLIISPSGKDAAANYTITAAAPAAARVLTISDPGGAASFVFTAGTSTISGVKSFSAQPKMTAATNQLGIFPSNGAVGFNINAAAPAATRIYTLPDAGAAANFIMSEGTSLFTNTARIDVVNQRLTLGSTATHTQKTYMFAGAASGSRVVIGESATESRGMISTNLTNSGTFGLDTDIGDTTRMIGLTNLYTTTQAASRGCAINFQNLGSGGGNTGRTYNDIFVNREVANSSTGAYLFNGFDPTFANYYTSHRLGYQLYSFIGGQGNAGVVLNSNVNPTGLFMMGSISPKVVVGDGSIQTTGHTYVTGGLHTGAWLDVAKTNWRIPISVFNAVTSGGVKTYTIFSPTFTSSSVNFMIYVKFNLMVEILDPTRIQANNNMSSAMVTYTGTYYYNPSSSTQGLVAQDAVKQTDINSGANRLITPGSITITNSGTVFSPIFNLNVTLSGASIATSNISIAGDVMMDINSTSGYMTSYS